MNKEKYINETWLSNQLAWLLDLNGNHGINSKFANEFFPKVLKKKELRGDEDFSKFEVCREFYLQINDLTKQKNNKAERRIDLVFMDLTQKSIIVVENKLNGINSENQLSYYMQIENIFPDCEIYYIFLSMDGKKYLLENESESDKIEKNYNCVSWNKDVLEILEKEKSNNYEIFKLYENIKNYQQTLELDFTNKEILMIAEILINSIDEMYGLTSNNSKWFIENNKLSTKNKKQKIYFMFNSKSFEIKFSKNIYIIQNSFSNKQIIYYMIYVLEKATKLEKKNAYKNKEIQSINYDELYHNLFKKQINLKEK